MEDLIRRTVGPGNEVEVVGAGGLWTTRIDQSQLEPIAAIRLPGTAEARLDIR
jgi:hypothetical protein